ncbi:MAG TPA: hypothetical protein VJ044_04590 [Candidatus Hodarchaeales archaeon]|nr:hypothetical protein [Candidatus Hodarchaeales archaeon]
MIVGVSAVGTLFISSSRETWIKYLDQDQREISVQPRLVFNPHFPGRPYLAGRGITALRIQVDRPIVLRLDYQTFEIDLGVIRSEYYYLEHNELLLLFGRNEFLRDVSISSDQEFQARITVYYGYGSSFGGP